MADIRLNINGDSSGAVGALNDVGDAAGVAFEAATKAVAKYGVEAIKSVVKFGVDSVKAYADAERAMRQLERAAGSYAGSLDRQAQALSRLYAVDDDVIKQSEILLTQWGGVGAATESVETAALNLAAAFGGDLQSATNDLIRNVESGGTSLAKMGIHFTATGDKGKDLAAAVAAINEKLGGAAAADANSLTGQLRAAGLAFDDVKKSIGESISAFITQHDIVGRLTEALRGLQTALGAGDVVEQNAKNEAYAQLQEHLNANLQQRKQLLAGIAEMEARGEDSPKSKAMVAHLDANIAKLKEIIRLENERIAAGDPTAPTVTGTTNKGMKDAAAGDFLSDPSEGWKKSFQEETLQQEDEMAKASVEIERQRVTALKAEGEVLADFQEEESERRKKMVAGENESLEASIRASITLRNHQLETARQQVLREEQAWADAGTAIGQALVNSIASELEKLANGGEMDAGEAIANVIGDVLAVAGQVIGTAIGSAYGGAAGAQLGGAIGGAAGGLAGAGVKALGRAGRSRKYHSGGPIGDEIDVPRYHSGGALASDEMHIIAQKGENMWSRADVAAAGGQQAVEQMKGGGTRFNFTINTIDALGTRQFFENDGGRGFLNALRTGRGSLAPAFGGG